MIRIVMLSGGADSVGLLVKSLENNDDLIHVHHIVLKTCENRWQAENEAVEKIVEYCRDYYRPFGFSASTYEFPSFGIGYTGMDLITTCFIGSNVVRAVQNQFLFSHNVLPDAELSIGFTSDDIEPGTDWNTTIRRIQADKIFEAQFMDYENTKPKIVYPTIDLSQQELYGCIPEGLKYYTFSCRNPVYLNGYPIPCGMCHSCQKVI